MSDSEDSDFEYESDHNNYNHENDHEDYESDDEPESDFLNSDYDYKIILEDEDSHVELDIDQQIKDLAEANKRDIHVARDQLFNKIGILDPFGLEDNPLTGQPYENLYFKPELKRKESYKDSNGFTVRNNDYAGYAEMWTDQPMYKQREELIQTIYDNQVILIISGTGSGKTLLTPKFALHVLNYKGRIAITLPKIPTVTSQGPFAANRLDVKLGEHVSMHYSTGQERFKSNTSNLAYMTEGTLVSALNKSPLLLEYDCVIIDEVHERTVNIDKMILNLKEVCRQRPEFKLILMSATIDKKLFENYFPSSDFKYKSFDAEGTTSNFKTDEYFLDDPILKKLKLTSSVIEKNGRVFQNPKHRDYVHDQVTIALAMIKEFPKMDKDILIFVGGVTQCRNGMEYLEKKLKSDYPELEGEIYYGKLLGGGKTSDEEQNNLINQGYLKIPNTNYKRAIIFSTEVAESSITINSLHFVIDSALVHKPRFYYQLDCKTSEAVGVAKSAHKQRKGRTGRTMDGKMFNLYTRDFYEKHFRDYSEYPIQLENMSYFVLKILGDPEKVSHIEFPFSYNYFDTKSLNCQLGRFIEPPERSKVELILKKMYALNIFNIRGTRGYLNDLGLAISMIEESIEDLVLKKMVVMGYVYQCLPEMLRLVVFLGQSEFNLSKIFIDLKKEKEKLIKEDRENEIPDLVSKFKKNVLKYRSPYGDCMSIINVINEYYRKKDGHIDDLSNRIISNPLDEDEFNYWCKMNFINKSFLKNLKKGETKSAKYNIDRLQYSMNKVLQFFREKYPDKTFIEIMEPYKVLDTQNKETNLLLAISDSCLPNLITRSNNNKNYDTVLFREHQVKKYLYIFKILKLNKTVKLSKFYFKDDSEFYYHMYYNYNFLKNDIKIINKKEEPVKSTKFGSGPLKQFLSSRDELGSFYTLSKENHRFLTYINFGNVAPGKPNEFNCLHVIPPSIINLLKSSLLENEMKRSIFMKANIPVKIVQPIVYTKKKDKGQRNNRNNNQTRKKPIFKRGGMLSRESRKKKINSMKKSKKML